MQGKEGEEMTNVVAFPKRAGMAPGRAGARPAVDTANKPDDVFAKVRSVAGKVLFGLLVVVGAFWPFLRWVLAIDVFLKFVVMLWDWHTPGTHAGWVFTAHMAVLVALTLALANHKPKD